MRYLLDTCVISDFIKGEPGTTTKLKQTLLIEIAISTITVMESRYGLALNPQRALKIEQAIASILTSANILSMGIAEAEHAAQNYLSLKN
jgi:tRNA(fMet)-specific endonuclease VapC